MIERDGGGKIGDTVEEGESLTEEEETKDWDEADYGGSVADQEKTISVVSWRSGGEDRAWDDECGHRKPENGESVSCDGAGEGEVSGSEHCNEHGDAEES